jgi:hypothetical protein
VALLLEQDLLEHVAVAQHQQRVGLLALVGFELELGIAEW